MISMVLKLTIHVTSKPGQVACKLDLIMVILRG